MHREPYKQSLLFHSINIEDDILRYSHPIFALKRHIILPDFLIDDIFIGFLLPTIFCLPVCFPCHWKVMQQSSWLFLYPVAGIIYLNSCLACFLQAESCRRNQRQILAPRILTQYTNNAQCFLAFISFFISQLLHKCEDCLSIVIKFPRTCVCTYNGPGEMW